MLRSRDLVVAAALVVPVAGCSNGTSIVPASITAPSNPSAPPSSSVLTLSGRVTESAPTESRAIAGATLTISAGPDAGRSTTTDIGGRYTFADLRSGAIVVDVAAHGYVGVSESIPLDTDMKINVGLKPERRIVDHAWTGKLAPSDGTCSDGAATLPCVIVAFSMHNAGSIDAQLSWSAGSAIDLNLSLFQTGVATPILRSASDGVTPESMAVMVSGGAHYELRVTYASGTVPADYKLHVVHPN
jgi:hypothetical protein